MDDVAVYVCQSEVAAAVSVGQLFVIQSHQVQNCGVQVMDVTTITTASQSG